jgi:trehalose/maltose hydrolase-like predicted phosphorylase
VAWAVWAYWEATRDERFLAEKGAEILLETARFWESRGEWGADGRFHVREVIGPDEYHEGVDDNAFTNRMARWNLEKGLQVRALLAQRWPEPLRALEARLGLTPEELARWSRAAQGMAFGVDPRTGLIEQFAGYFALEDFDFTPLREQGKVSAPMDMILGRERAQRSQVVKQSDVVMLLQLLWDELPPEARLANFRYYEPRTCHGSSLSPGTHALVAARLGELETAQRYFKQAGEIDLANNMGNAAGGVHAAALGGLWQAAVFGFGGVAVRGESLRVEPRVPPSWRALRFPLCFRGRGCWLCATAEAGGGALALPAGRCWSTSWGWARASCPRAGRWRRRRGTGAGSCRGRQPMTVELAALGPRAAPRAACSRCFVVPWTGPSSGGARARGAGAGPGRRRDPPPRPRGARRSRCRWSSSSARCGCGRASWRGSSSSTS